MDDKFSRQAVITGGQGDLAKAITDRLREAGYVVHAPGREELDVTDASAVDAYFSREMFRDGVDLLINNAGIRRDQLFVKMKESDWDIVLDTNLKGAFLCSRAVLKKMFRQRSGHIVNIGSFSALSGPSGQCAYAASKAGMIGFTKSIAAEGGRRNFRANCVLPGFLETKFVSGMSDDTMESALNRHVLGKFNTVSDAADFICRLDQMNGVSGQVFQLDSRL